MGQGGGLCYHAPLLIDLALTDGARRAVVLDGVIAVGAIGHLGQAARTRVGLLFVLHSMHTMGWRVQSSWDWGWGWGWGRSPLAQCVR